jgi:enoyl-CoA hydratase
MSYETVTFERRGPIGLLTLNRPDKLNAINQTMVAEIGQALDVAEADDDVRVVVLNGAGRSFCAGFDLGQPGSEKKKGVLEWRQILTEDFDMILRFWELSKPTISAVHGYVLAGGFEMAISCDVTISDESAMFGEPELKFGAGIVALVLPWITGPKQAKELLFTGNDRVPADRALALGLINKIVPDGEALEAALAMARDMAVMDPAKLAMTKVSINRTYDRMGMRDALREALDMDVLITTLVTPEGEEFKRIMREDGLKAAVKWRDSRFGAGE